METTTHATYLPDMIGWNARQPTVEECGLVGRDVSYADPFPGSGIRDGGDYVIETPSDVQGQAALARALECATRRMSSRLAFISKSDREDLGSRTKRAPTCALFCHPAWSRWSRRRAGAVNPHGYTSVVLARVVLHRRSV